MKKRIGSGMALSVLLLTPVLFFCCFSAAFLSCGARAEDWTMAEIIEEIDLPEPGETLLATDVDYYTPNEINGHQCNHAICFWNLKMGCMDEEAIWQVLTQPVTVLKGAQREQIRARKEPDASCEEYTGVITCASQAVHVLDRGEEWTLVEAYSSCEEGSIVKVWALPFQGYVKTSLLEEKEVDRTYGLVIDKQQQRLYVFEKGKLLSTLLCSTGYYNPKKKNPWNETPAGEFLCISWTGDFPLKDDDGNTNMICKNAIRINDGILIHEVPMIPRTDSAGNVKWTYDRCERYLGEKASHGCIRVQQRKTPEGINEEWLWKNLSNGTRKGKNFTKVIIWDDAGREIGYPDDELKLYYNAKRDKSYYHSSPDCVRIKGSSKTVTFTYGELEDKTYKKLKPCPNCAPQLRKEAIDTLNKKNNR